MSPADFAKAMREVVADEERAHEIRDDLMCKLLRELGYGEGVDVFEKSSRWYA